jgi:hypothetical protein
MISESPRLIPRYPGRQKGHGHETKLYACAYEHIPGSIVAMEASDDGVSDRILCPGLVR